MSTFATALGEFQSIAANVGAGGAGSPAYTIGPAGSAPYTQPPSGVTAAAWNAVLDAVKQFEGNPNYGYGCPSHCCDPATEDCRALASHALASWYAKFGNLIQALNYYNTGKPDQGYGAQAASTAQVFFAGAGGVGNELSAAGGLTINPGGAAGQSRASAVTAAVTDPAAAVTNWFSSIKWTTVVVAIVGIILIGIAANQISKG